MTNFTSYHIATFRDGEHKSAAWRHAAGERIIHVHNDARSYAYAVPADTSDAEFDAWAAAYFDAPTVRSVLAEDCEIAA